MVEVSVGCTWEEAVQWLREQSDQQELVHNCFYDDPIEGAAERFYQTTEWQETQELLKSHLPGRVLDIGAGRGIAAFAFARGGSQVTALEPDPSSLVGRGAINELCRRTGVKIDCVEGYGEGLPFLDGSFDVVYGRAVLHHARELPSLIREVARVLRPKGRALFTREHVISRVEDLPMFLEAHALHKFYGGEHAYLLSEYRSALTEAGIGLCCELGPFECVINYWPNTNRQIQQVVYQHVRRRVGGPLARLLLKNKNFLTLSQRWLSRKSNTPGRLFTFLGEKI